MKTLIRHIGKIAGRLVPVLGIWVVSLPLYAASLQVTPTNLVFEPGDQSHRLWLINNGERTIQAQVRLFGWAQEQDREVLQASQAFALSPAMVSIPPGERQLVRVIRRPAQVNAAAQREASFRILVDELPVANGSGEQGVNFVFRYSLPLFVWPSAKMQLNPDVDLQWSLRNTETGVVLSLQNNGSKSAQIADLIFMSPPKQMTIKDGLFGYVLAGQTREWRLDNVDADVVTRTKSIRAVINGELVEHSIGGDAQAR